MVNDIAQSSSPPNSSKFQQHAAAIRRYYDFQLCEAFNHAQNIDNNEAILELINRLDQISENPEHTESAALATVAQFINNINWFMLHQGHRSLYDLLVQSMQAVSMSLSYVLWLKLALIEPLYIARLSEPNLSEITNAYAWHNQFMQLNALIPSIDPGCGSNTVFILKEDALRQFKMIFDSATDKGLTLTPEFIHACAELPCLQEHLVEITPLKNEIDRLNNSLNEFLKFYKNRLWFGCFHQRGLALVKEIESQLKVNANRADQWQHIQNIKDIHNILGTLDEPLVLECVRDDLRALKTKVEYHFQRNATKRFSLFSITKSLVRSKADLASFFAPQLKHMSRSA